MSELKVGQRFVWEKERCLSVEDHMMAGGVAFVILTGSGSGETGYVEGDDLGKEVERPKINVDGDKLEATIKDLERMLSSAVEKKTTKKTRQTGKKPALKKTKNSKAKLPDAKKPAAIAAKKTPRGDFFLGGLIAQPARSKRSTKRVGLDARGLGHIPPSRRSPWRSECIQVLLV